MAMAALVPLKQPLSHVTPPVQTAGSLTVVLPHSHTHTQGGVSQPTTCGEINSAEGSIV